MKSFTRTNWNSNQYRQTYQSILAESPHFRKFGLYNLFKSKIDSQKFSGRSAPDLPKNVHCNLCEYRTVRISNLRRHLITMHQNRGNMTLTCCNESFQDKASYRIHARTVHQHGHECLTCHRIFTRRALLRRHQSVHTGVKEFGCHLCPYATSHKSNLQRHFKIHVRGTKAYSPRATTTTDNSSMRYLTTNSLKKRRLIGGGLHPGASVSTSLVKARVGVGIVRNTAETASFRAPAQFPHGSQGWPTPHLNVMKPELSHSIESILSRPNQVGNQILESSWIKSENLGENEPEITNRGRQQVLNVKQENPTTELPESWSNASNVLPLSDVGHMLSYLAAMSQFQQTNSSTVPVPAVPMNQTSDLRLHLNLNYYNYIRSLTSMSLSSQEVANPSSPFSHRASNSDYLRNPLGDVNGALPYSLNYNSYLYQNHCGLDFMANQAQAQLIVKQEQDKRPTSLYCMQRNEPSLTCCDTASAPINTSFNAFTFTGSTPFSKMKTGKRGSKNSRSSATVKNLGRKSQSRRVHHELTNNNAEGASTARSTNVENCHTPLKKCLENSCSNP